MTSPHISLTTGGVTLTFKLIANDVLSGGNVDYRQKTRTRGKYANAPAGQLPLLYTLPLRMDGMGTTPAKDRSVRNGMNTLWRWAEFKVRGGKTLDPPIISLTGGIRSPSGMQWIITTLTENGYQVNEFGVLVQYDVTVELTEYVKTAVSPAAKAKSKKVAKNTASDAAVGYAYLAKHGG